MARAHTAQLRRGWHAIVRRIFEYRSEVILLSLLGVISALGNGMVPFLIGRFFDALLALDTTLPNSDIPLWAALLGAWVLVQVVTNVVDWIISVRADGMDTRLHTSFTGRGYATLLRLPVAFHKAHRVGETTERINRAARHLSSVARVFITIAPQLLSVVVGIAIAIFIHPVFAGVLAAGIALYLVLLVGTVLPAAKFIKAGHKGWRVAYGDAFDAVSNVFAVKQATAEAYEEKRIIRAFEGRAFRLWMKVERIWNNVTFYQRIVVVLTQLTIFILSVYLIAQGAISIGDVIAINGYAGMVFGPFVQLGFNWQTIQNSAAAVDAAERILTTTPEEHQGRGMRKKVEPFVGSVSFEGVSFAYPDEKAKGVLHNISFTVPEGSVVALVGESGVGKSTVVDLISGYYAPQKGRVLVSGAPTTAHDLAHLRSHIAIVPQEPVLFNDTVEHNIKYGSFRATRKDVIRAAKQAHADIFIDGFRKQYRQLVGERGIKLSVGQKQRIAIARAFVRDPRILILDEPTSALDAQTEQYITASLEALMEGRTTFIVAHRLSTVRRADMILVFDGGRIVERGTHAQLMKNKDGVYRRLYAYQTGTSQ